jgi:hypothetical protein
LIFLFICGRIKQVSKRASEQIYKEHVPQANQENKQTECMQCARAMYACAFEISGVERPSVGVVVEKRGHKERRN